MSLNIHAQTNDADEARDLIEKYIENSESTVDYTDLYDQIDALLKVPVNINTAGADGLMKIPLMTPQKIQEIITHRNRYGNFTSIYELQQLEGFDKAFIQMILPFISIDQPLTFKNIGSRQLLKAGTHEMIGLVTQRLEQSKGYTLSDSNPNKYLGSAQRAVLRYKGTIGEHLQINLTTEKDAGEQLNTRTLFISGAVFLKDIKRFKLIAIGDYQAAFGQGLTFGSGLAFGKSPFVLNVLRTQNGLRAYRSLNENEFLRGAGITYQLHKHVTLTSFYSSNKIDATVTADSLQNEEGFSGFVTSGYYRNTNEISKRHAITRRLIGSHLTMQYQHLELGLTAVNTRYDKALTTGNEPYQLYTTQGNTFYNFGMDYKWYYHNMVVFGEWSTNAFNHLSTVNGALISLGKQLDISVLYRHYDKSYQTSISNAIGEYTDNKNENGCYAGFALTPAKNFKLNGYLDVYRAPWLRYGVDAASSGKDALLELQYSKRKKYNWYLRYRNEHKQKNEDGTQILNRMEDNERSIWRFHIETNVSPAITLRNRVEWTKSVLQYGQTTRGFLMFQDVVMAASRQLKITARLMYFDVDDFNARVFAYESDMLYAFSVPAFQNRGTRFYVLAKYKLNKNADIWMRFARTAYENQNAVGSGYDTISGNRASDIKLQIKWTL
ncbi:MAG: helix-hairpin-helix domain-containing protein [Bacteroidota bacterium]